ncbi:MAG: sugar transporter [Maritimibacter sp.]|nr:sugar transporter [Maritimibacter sp.]
MANLKGQAVSADEGDSGSTDDTTTKPAEKKARAARAVDTGQGATAAEQESAKAARKARAAAKAEKAEKAGKAEKPVDGDGATADDPKAERRAARKAAAEESRKQGGEPQVIEIRPIARKARMRSRHWGLFAAFVLMVLLPVSGVGFYMYGVAVDQYASSSGFSVRKEELSSPGELMGGLSQFMGGSSDAEADMLYAFIQSQDLVTQLDERLDLRGHYTAVYDDDPIFGLAPGGTIEDLVSYWHRIVKVTYDQGTGLISLHVRAFTPEMAQRLSEEIIAESQVLVNELNSTSRNDMLKYAEQDLVEAVARLKKAREALAHFRSRTQIVDPESDLRGRMGVLASLQQQLAQALIDYDLVSTDSSSNDPRVIAAARRIEVIQERISEERDNLSDQEPVDGTESYPSLLAEYEGLVVDREYSEGAYAAALAALDGARANAARQSRYLATYLKPTVPERPEYPQRGMILGLAGLFLLLFWAISSMMFYALRDRK